PAWILPAVLVVIAGLGAGLYFALAPKGGTPQQQAQPQATLPDRVSFPSGDMVLVPAGPFQQGEKKTTVSLDAYYIDRTEVSNRAYQQFCTDTKHPLPTGFPTDR